MIHVLYFFSFLTIHFRKHNVTVKNSNPLQSTKIKAEKIMENLISYKI